MKFISKIPSLKVVIQTPRRLMDPYSSAQGTTIPGKFAVFVRGVYETTDASVIRIMVEKWKENALRNLTTTFWPDPREEKNANALYEKIKKSGLVAEGIITDKDEAIRQLLLEVERLKEDLNKKGGRVTRAKSQLTLVENGEQDNSDPDSNDLQDDDLEDPEESA